MTTIINADNGIVSGISGLTQTGDASGVLAIQSSGNTVATFGSNLNVAVVGNVSAANIVVTTGITYSNGAAYSSGGGLTWSTVQTANLTAVASTAYLLNTSSRTITVTLPASPTAGTLVTLVDYAQTFTANAVTVYANGLKINGNTSNIILNSSSQSVGLVYADSTQGWIAYTGFASTPIGPYYVDYLVVAGGGGGGSWGSGGAGGGGMLTGSMQLIPGTGYTVSIGAGGSANNNGTTSYFSSVSTVGGGAGANWQSYGNGQSGGSGGGATWIYTNSTGLSGTGTAGQGYAGGGPIAYANSGNHASAGGGGAGGVGGNPPNVNSPSGDGGVGRLSTIDGNSYYYAGGGGGGTHYSIGGTGGLGGGGGGGASSGYPGGAGGASGRNSGNAGSATPGGAGGANTGGGGGAGGGGVALNGGTGGSGIVIVRYTGGQRGTGGTVTSSGGYTIHTFLTSGTFIA